MEKKLWLVFCITLTLFLTTLSIEEPIENTLFQWSRTFSETLHLATQKHFNPANIEQAMIKAIDAFCTTLDPHSSFLDPKAYKAMLESTSGEFFGIGVVIDNTRKTKDKFLLIVDTIPDGPSDKAGIKALDKMVEINGKPLEGLTTEEITATLRGERGSAVSIKVLRENQQDLLSFAITRDVIKEQNSLSFYIKEHNIYYISLTTFSETASQQIKKLLSNTNKHNYRGLILDLRNNSGGLLTAAVDIAGLFLEKNSLVAATKDRNNKETERYVTNSEPIAKNSLPVFVMVNNHTASAAEILAGNLKTYSEMPSKSKTPRPMVFLVGTTTFGKGSVQQVIPVSNNCAVKLTTHLYFLPNDITVQGAGIEPDFTIERMLPATEQMLWFIKNYGRENTLENYINPKKTTAEQPTAKVVTPPEKTMSSKDRWEQRAKNMLENDNQLRQTIALIDMLAKAQQSCPQLVNNRASALSFLSALFVGDKTLTAQSIEM